MHSDLNGFPAKAAQDVNMHGGQSLRTQAICYGSFRRRAVASASGSFFLFAATCSTKGAKNSQELSTSNIATRSFQWCDSGATSMFLTAAYEPQIFAYGNIYTASRCRVSFSGGLISGLHNYETTVGSDITAPKVLTYGAFRDALTFRVSCDSPEVPFCLVLMRVPPFHCMRRP